jgi:cell division inhibitor SulA
MLYRQDRKIHTFSNIQPLPKTQRECKTGITEIVLPNTESLDMVMPTLAFLSRSQNTSHENKRWLTWFPPTRISKADLSEYGFDLSCIRFVYPKNDEHCYWLFWEALAEGNSHTVVASPGRLSEQQLQRLEHASNVGECSGLLLRNRIH